MDRAGGNISQAARLLGISGPTLRAKLAGLLPKLAKNTKSEID
jgi:hypothetical protein